MYEQISVFLMSCLIGGVLGFIYDIFRISRIAIKTHRIAIFIEDVVFFVIVTIMSFTFIIVENNGEIRGLLIIGEVIGAIIYFYTISVILLKSSKIIIKFLKWILAIVYKITIKPFVTLFSFINNKISVKLMQIKLQKILDELNFNN